MELLQQDAMRWFALSYLVLVLKMMAVGWATSFYRVRYRVFAAPEDYALQGSAPTSGSESQREQIERTRRAHQNDLENILPFFAVGLFYALTQPQPSVAAALYATFLMARVLHSVFYLAGLQPWRSLAFLLGQTTMLVMLVLTLWRIAA